MRRLQQQIQSVVLNMGGSWLYHWHRLPSLLTKNWLASCPLPTLKPILILALTLTLTLTHYLVLFPFLLENPWKILGCRMIKFQIHLDPVQIYVEINTRF